MKKFILLALVFIGAASLAFAVEFTANGYIESTDGTIPQEPAKTVVTLNLSGKDGSAYMLFGFVENGDAYTTTDPDSDEEWASAVSLTMGDSVATGSVDAWWHIIYGGQLSIQVGLDGNLLTDNNTYSSEEIPWGIYKANESDSKLVESISGEAEISALTYEEVATFDGVTGTIEQRNHETLTLKTLPTTDFTKLHKGKFSGYLYMKIEDKGV